jgi:uncharacterized protein
MSLTVKVMAELKEAMKAKNEAGLRALRAIKAAILLAQTEKGAGAELSDDEELKILQKLAKQRKESIDVYVAQNREDLAKDERAELEIIEKFLPAQMSAEEIEKEISNIIQSIGAKGPGDMGKVMGQASKALAGKADNKIVSEIVKRLLQ